MKYLLALVAALVGLAASQTPIPSRPQGKVVLFPSTQQQLCSPGQGQSFIAATSVVVLPAGYVLLEARTERQVVVEAFYDQ